MEDQEVKLIEEVKKNKKTRLAIKPNTSKEIKQDQININENFRGLK